MYLLIWAITLTIAVSLNRVICGHEAEAIDLRYGDLALRYQDTIVGHLYGHMYVFANSIMIYS
jgi:hypothetical protein